MASQWYLTVILVIILTTCEAAQEIQTTACDNPENVRVKLTCSASQWLHVKSERYSAIEEGAEKCVDSFDCPSAMASSGTGLDVSCNGPVSSKNGGVCQEAVKAKDVLERCGANTSWASVTVGYECVSGADVVDMCSNFTQTWQRIFEGFDISAYLVTPQFPNTPALSQHCSCQVKGENLRIWAFEIQLDLPTTDMLTVMVEDKERWHAQRTCPTCHHLQYINEALHFPEQDENSSFASIDFQDYNQPGQLVWLEIQGSGANLTITCQSVSVPPPPTTTTTTSTTTTTTSTSTTTPIITTTTTTTTEVPISRTPGVGTTSRDSGVDGPPTTPTRGGTTTSSGQGPGGNGDFTHSAKDGQDGGGGEDSAVIVGLTILALVLVTVALVFGILIWRRHQLASKGGQFQEAGSSSGCSGHCAFLSLNYWYNQYRNRQQSQDNNPPVPMYGDIPINDFHSFEGDYVNSAVDVDSDMNEENEMRHHDIDKLGRRGERDEDGCYARLGAGAVERASDGHPGMSTVDGSSTRTQKVTAGAEEGAGAVCPSVFDSDTSPGTFADTAAILSSASSEAEHQRQSGERWTKSKDTNVSHAQDTPGKVAKDAKDQHAGKSKTHDLDIIKDQKGKSPSDESSDNDRKQKRKEKIVADVLSKTLESIKTQREALTATPTQENQVQGHSSPSVEKEVADRSIPSDFDGSRSGKSSSNENHDDRHARKDKHSSKHHHTKKPVDSGNKEASKNMPEDMLHLHSRRHHGHGSAESVDSSDGLTNAGVSAFPDRCNTESLV